MTITKMKRVDLPAVEDGIVAFQMVEIKGSFYGREVVSMLDTKIMEDGSQVIIDGDGWFKAGTVIA